LANALKSKSRIDVIDITFIVVMFMIGIFIANAWKDPVSLIMLTITSLILAMFFLSRLTGALGFLEITKPFWTITAILSIFIWTLVFMFLPAAGVSTASGLATDVITQNTLDFFLPAEISVNIIQSFYIPIVESLLVAFIVSFFAAVGIKQSFGSRRRANSNIVFAVIIAAVFGALIHIAIAVQLATIGVYDTSVIFGHQLLSFFIMVVIGVFTPAGTAGIIVSHVVKNLLVFGTPTVWIFSFVIFILLDILSFVFAARKEKAGYINRLDNIIT